MGSNLRRILNGHILFLGVFAFGLYFSAPHVHAREARISNETRLIRHAISLQQNFIQQARSGNVSEPTKISFGLLVSELSNYLIANEQHDLAQELISQYEANKFKFDAIQFLDLGDHAPLFPFIDDIIRKAEQRLGTVIFGLPIVKDIYTLNFAIPVVFNPNGIWRNRQDHDRIEYRKHFIPFSTIVTHYGVRYGCIAYAKKQGMGNMDKFCTMAADQLRLIMGRYIAPPLSDFVYRTVTGDASFAHHDHLTIQSSKEEQ